MASSPALLPLDAVERRTGFRKSRLYELIGSGSFPSPVRIGRAVRFVEREVDDWVAARIAERDAALGVNRTALLRPQEIATELGVTLGFLERDRKSAVPTVPVTWVGPHPRYDLAAVRQALAGAAA